MTHVVVLTTGGTISTRDVDGSGARPVLRGQDLLQQIPDLGAVAEVEVAELAFVPGAFMTLATMRQMSERARQILSQAQVAGLVVTHGTDTLEESAYLLYLTVDTDKPVVFTGAMRNSSQIGFDGYRNLYDAIRVAVSESARGLGTVVVLNEEIHSARWVTKTNGQKEDTYESPATGPVGVVYGDGPHVFTRPLPHPVLPPRLEPRVDLIRLCVDGDDKFIRCAAEAGTRGLVLEVFGGGRINPPLLPALDRALAGGMMIVATTRCITGNMWDMYGYEGAFRDLQRRGVIFAHDLPGHKARLKLMLALGNGLSRAQAGEYFEKA
ncbi:MAG: asparaginase [Bacillati bacterium ANGP1]|uniref:asparaginase n=1 Tax=Candidatus Segetimicrobium genomatis TaxID=2569760 RepID=A0A537LGC5_9BACT|nr:MAG: asparaginase [Terrabacteria group bacterium ANGP1]